MYIAVEDAGMEGGGLGGMRLPRPKMEDFENARKMDKSLPTAYF